jgi:hypothetical protein
MQRQKTAADLIACPPEIFQDDPRLAVDFRGVATEHTLSPETVTLEPSMPSCLHHDVLQHLLGRISDKVS